MIAPCLASPGRGPGGEANTGVNNNFRFFEAGMRWLIVVGGVAATLAAAASALTFWQAVRLVRPVRAGFDLRPEELGATYEEVRFPGPAGALSGWYFPGTNGRTLLGLHGVAGTRQQWLKPAVELQRRGYGVLIFDFRRHGESEGRHTTFGDHEVRDVVAALDYLAGQEQT